MINPYNKLQAHEEKRNSRIESMKEKAAELIVFITKKPLNFLFPIATDKIIVEDDFEKELRLKFGYKSIKKILKTLNKLDVVIPENSTDFFKGTDGIMIFMEDYGLSVKIEHPKCPEGPRAIHKNVLQPIFQKTAGKAVVDIIPGIIIDRTEDGDDDDLRDLLKKDGVWFHDKGKRNVGFLPIITTESPKGIQATIDTLSVADLTQKTMNSKKWRLNLIAGIKHRKKRRDEYNNSKQSKFYRPLLEAFKEGFNTGKMDKAWKLCQEFKDNGKLVSGWKDVREKEPKFSKCHTDKVFEASRNYSKTVKASRPCYN